MKPRSVLVIDDHPLIRDAICQTLLDIDPSLHVRIATRLSEALELLLSEPSDLITLDLSLPDTSGMSGLSALCRAHPSIPIAVCSGHVDARTVHQAIDAGAVGFVPKSFEQGGIATALRTGLSGTVYLPPLEPGQRHRLSPVTSGGSGVGRIEDLDLSTRQIDVLRLLVRGLPNKLICRQLNIAEGTVKAHVSAVLSKLGARNRTEAVIAVSRIDLGSHGLLHRDATHEAPRAAT